MAGDTPRHIDTQLADRLAALEASHASISTSNPGSPQPEQPKLKARKSGGGPDTTQTSADALARIRIDLAEAQRGKAELQKKLQEVTERYDRLKSKTQQDAKKITELSTERNGLARRVKDRDEELRGKAKLLEDVQDEMVSLNLQLNMAEEHLQESRRENKELVDRWMARMGREADAMNNASKFS
ncbi:MAG: hypothetical protein M1833_002299 [Piccolia ochrophora]|nr:MAG: hypothetical protein M1833_002299 [Piccolia ochrophora]